MSEYEAPPTESSKDRDRGGRHRLMIACCVPMLLTAVALVVAGVINAGFLLAAVGCAAMMYLMMRAMGGSEPHAH